jgi:hypothetical protein
MDDHTRFAQLRAQDGRPKTRPPGLESVLGPTGAIEPWRLGEVRQLWSATRRHLLTAPADVAAAERFLFLTNALSNQLAAAGDDAGRRALFEGALEALSLPRHRQEMRGHLARLAVRENDAAGAQAWLTGCDPASADLEMDTAYRISLAMLSTAQNDAARVLHVLGGDETLVPIADQYDPLATVLRANAWERTGNVEAARNVLARFMTGQGGVSAAIESIVKAMPAHWNVCAQSLAVARVDHRQHVASRAGGGEWIGWLIVVVGCLPALITIPVLLASDAPAFAGLFTLIFPLAFAPWGISMIRRARRQRVVARTGLQARGRVVGVSPTGTRVNNVPMMRIDVQVQAPGHAPVTASMTKLLHPHQASMLMGRELSCIWSPAYPQDVVLEI